MKPADALVIFGITGDLARKQTFGSLYMLERRGHLDCPIVGVAIEDWTTARLRQHARKAITEAGVKVEKKVFDRLAERLTYVSGDFGNAATYERVGEALNGARTPVFYLEIPPSLFATVVHGLADAGLTDRARVVIEKPFGHDLASAKALHADLLSVLEEPQILRIDHYLGKEPVMDIAYLRFANTLFEPIWNRNHVSCVQITKAEDFGVADRGSFYDPVGALRDVVQNHLLQVLALVAMEPPAGQGLDPIRDQKTQLFKAIPPAKPEHYVRGQYDGYLKVKGVKKGSKTETFAALRLAIDNWRWDGVPFFLRAGKELAEDVTEVRVTLKRPPRLGIGKGVQPEPNQVVIRIDPSPGASILVRSKRPGEDALDPVHLDLLFGEQQAEQPTPYERLLADAIRGDGRLFTREDGIEESWRIVEPLLKKPGRVRPYKRGSWGPKAADELVKRYGGWHHPWLP